ncbi:MAG: carboxypeptidase-like regulatory domain-containing protein [Spirochaetales bacterium]|nr:carboxypeptidase-like regulatory domain-containing protein [Spirochaetales bacterium]
MMKKFPKLSFNVVLLLIIVLIAIALPAWKAIQGTGVIRGQVVDAEGRPVEDAQVRIREKTLNLIKEGQVVATDQNGTFIFTDMEMIEFIVDASHADGRASAECRYHTYFPGQHFELPEPVVLQSEYERDKE